MFFTGICSLGFDGVVPFERLVSCLQTTKTNQHVYQAIEAPRQTAVVSRRKGLPSVQGLIGGELPDSGHEEVDVLARFYISQPLACRSDQQWRVSLDAHSVCHHTSESLQ